jgi:hypothetical protein
MTERSTRTRTIVKAPKDRGPSAMPRIRLYKRRIAIEHSDPDAADRLLAEALGAIDRDALNGLIRQLAGTSMMGAKPDEDNLAFMVSMIRSIAPRDSLEAMLTAQMVSVHLLAMRCASRLAATPDPDRHEDASRVLTRLMRIFPAQIEALSRHRSTEDRTITLQSLPAHHGKPAFGSEAAQVSSVTEGDRAISGGAGVPEHPQAGTA